LTQFVRELKKRKNGEVTLYGEAALYLNYELPGMPCQINYTAATDILKDLEGKRLVECDYKTPYSFRKLKGDHDITYTNPLDTVCYAIHISDINTLVEYMLCNLDSFNSTEVRQRYAELYSRLAGTPGVSMRQCACTLPIETYCKNVQKSYIAAYMRKQRLSYAEFCSRVPSLCAELSCNEQNLNYAIQCLL